MTRLVAIGDSTTAGTPGWASPLEVPPGGRGDETSQYAYWLKRARPGWTVSNRGVNGERSDQIRARFERDVLGADDGPSAAGRLASANLPGAGTTIVVIIAGVNDIYQGLPAGHVIEQLRAMYERAAAAGLLVVAGTIVSYNTATPDQDARMREVNAWIRDYAAAHGIAFADTRAAVAAPGDPDRLFESPDQLHPSPEGYRRMAVVIEEAVTGTFGL